MGGYLLPDTADARATALLGVGSVHQAVEQLFMNSARRVQTRSEKGLSGGVQNMDVLPAASTDGSTAAPERPFFERVCTYE
jgi:hypothetical protein